MKHKVRIHSMLAIGLLAAILAQQTSMAQRPLDSPGSVLHGRTVAVANGILNELRPSITQYSQVTNLAQLSGITSLNLAGKVWVNSAGMQANDFVGLTNLLTLDISGGDISNDGFPDGLFDELTNLQTLNAANIKAYSFDDMDFIGLTNLQRLDLSDNNLLDTLNTRTFDKLVNLQELDLSGSNMKDT